jgi:hypothetical protein
MECVDRSETLANGMNRNGRKRHGSGTADTGTAPRFAMDHVNRSDHLTRLRARFSEVTGVFRFAFRPPGHPYRANVL